MPDGSGKLGQATHNHRQAFGGRPHAPIGTDEMLPQVDEVVPLIRVERNHDGGVAPAVFPKLADLDRLGERRGFLGHGIKSSAAPIGEEGWPWLLRFMALRIAARSAPCCRANEIAIAASDT